MQLTNNRLYKSLKELSYPTLMLCLLILWTPILLWQTWSIQHSSCPMIRWSGSDNTSCLAVMVNQPRIEMQEGESRKAEARVQQFGDNIGDNDVSWISMNPDIVRVSTDGLITGKAPGEAIVRANTSLDVSKYAEVKVKVNPRPVQITLHPKELPLKVDEVGNIEVAIRGTIPPDTQINWVSSAPNIASVDQTGRVTAISTGDTVITATLKGTNQRQRDIEEDTTTVRVTETSSLITKVEVVPKPLELYPGQEIPVKNLYSDPENRVTSIQAKVLGTGAFNPEVSWSIDKPEIASLSEEGTLIANSSGQTELTATSVQDPQQSDSAKLTVRPPEIISLSVKPETKQLRKGKKYRFRVEMRGKGTYNREVIWSSDNNRIASVDREGRVTTKRKGDARIYATSQQDDSKQGVAEVTVVGKNPGYCAAAGTTVAVAGSAIGAGTTSPAAIAAGAATTALCYFFY